MSTVKEAIEANTEAIDDLRSELRTAMGEVHDLLVIMKDERAQKLAERQTTASRLEVEKGRWEIIGEQVRTVAASSQVRTLVFGGVLLALNRLLEYLSR